MDPDAAWKEAVDLAGRLEREHYDDLTEKLDDGERLAQLVMSLHNWVENGNFPPAVFDRTK